VKEQRKDTQFLLSWSKGTNNDFLTGYRDSLEEGGASGEGWGKAELGRPGRCLTGCRMGRGGV
jgi:hypothetical protein